MKWFFLMIIASLLMMATATANDFAEVNTPITLYADIFDGSTYFNPANVNITIYNKIGAEVISNEEMHKFATGRYAFNFTTNNTGVYYAETAYYNSTDLVATASQSFTIVNSTATVVTGVEESLDMIFSAFLLVLLGLLFVLIAHITENAFWFFAGGTWFMAIAGITVFAGTYLNAVFYFLLGIGAIYQGINYVIMNKNEENYTKDKYWR